MPLIRKASLHDLDSIISILKSVGSTTKDPTQGFLITDYTLDTKQHRQKYAHDLSTLTYTYVYEGASGVEGFLIAYTLEEWLQEVPLWLNDIYWKPGFDKTLVNNSVLINQTAMYPHLTGQGIGSKLYQALFADLKAKGVQGLFAETIIAPVPNIASLHFRMKQKYELAGMRYEIYDEKLCTTLVYYRPVF